MNKYEKALSAVEHLKLRTDIDKDHKLMIAQKDQVHVEALRELVEKATPGKPYENIYGQLNCPSCDQTVGTYDQKKSHRKYCSACGKALDWSDYGKTHT